MRFLEPRGVSWSMTFLLCLLLACMTSCSEAREQRDDRQEIERCTDSLAAAGEHGYYVANYLVGRFKTSRAKGLPFEILVKRLDEQLLEKPLGLRFIDSAYYAIDCDGASLLSYDGEFNEVLSTDEMEVLISWPENLMQGNAATFQQRYQTFDYEFVVYKY